MHSHAQHERNGHAGSPRHLVWLKSLLWPSRAQANHRHPPRHAGDLRADFRRDSEGGSLRRFRGGFRENHILGEPADPISREFPDHWFSASQ